MEDYTWKFKPAETFVRGSLHLNLPEPVSKLVRLVIVSLYARRTNATDYLLA